MKAKTKSEQKWEHLTWNLVLWFLLIPGVNASGQSATIMKLSVSGASSFSVAALNQTGQVAGAYMPNGAVVPRPFLWSGGVTYDLGTLGGTEGGANALNDAGQAVGYSSTPGESQFHACLFGGGTVTDLGTLGGVISSALAINDAGQIAGYSYLSTVNLENRAFLYDLGTMHDLGTLGGTFSSGMLINDSGHVAGESGTTGDTETHAFLYSDGVMHDLGTIGGTFSSPNGLNNAGQVAGDSTTANDAELHAFLYSNGVLVDLGTLGGTFSTGFMINDAGQVIGDSFLVGDSEVHGFIYSGNAMRDLGHLGGHFSTVWSLNNLGQVVGVSSNATGLERAFLWQNGAMRDLNSLLPPNSGWELTAAYFINDARQVVGAGLYQGQPSWFFMTLPARVNQSPVANAGPDQTVECAGGFKAVTLDGTASTDPDGDDLTFAWREGNVPLGSTAVLDITVPLGKHTFTLHVSDTDGASSEDTVVVNVVDTTAPVLDCPAGVSASPDSNCQAAVPNFLANLTVSDNCTAPVALVKSQNPPAGTLVDVGVHVITLTVADAAGNQTTCTTSFTVTDTTPPAVVCPNGATGIANNECLAAVPDFLASLVTSDNCTPAGSLTKTQDPARGTMVGLGRHVVTVRVVDTAGNVSTCTTTFTVVDRTPPVIRSLSANPNLLTQINHEMVPVTLTIGATDNCDPSPVCRIVSVTSNEPVTGRGDNTSPDWSVTGNLTVNLRAENTSKDSARVYTITVACTDAAGNSSTATVAVTAQKHKNSGPGPLAKIAKAKQEHSKKK